jgi:hypothetical protein
MGKKQNGKRKKVEGAEPEEYVWSGTGLKCSEWEVDYF